VTDPDLVFVLCCLQSWHNDNVLLSVHAVKHVTSSGRIIFPHLEVNVYPLNIHVSYGTCTGGCGSVRCFEALNRHCACVCVCVCACSDGIMRFVEYFVGQKEKAQKKYEKYKTTFLPLSAQVLNLESKRPASSVHGVSAASAVAAAASASFAASASASATSPSHPQSASPTASPSARGSTPLDVVFPATSDTSSAAHAAQLLLSAIKHRRVLTVALELYNAHRAGTYWPLPLLPKSTRSSAHVSHRSIDRPIGSCVNCLLFGFGQIWSWSAHKRKACGLVRVALPLWHWPQRRKCAVPKPVAPLPLVAVTSRRVTTSCTFVWGALSLW
jgi:hypothetical protein